MKSANTKTSWNLLSKVTELVWQKEWIVPVLYFCYDNCEAQARSGKDRQGMAVKA